MRSLYIYYRVDASQSMVMQAAITQMQQTLRQAMPGLAASLHQRAPSNDTPMTWMEIYQFNGHANTQAWQKLTEHLQAQVTQLPAGIDGERHLEWFDRISRPTFE